MVANLCELGDEFPDASYDVVIDKATLDAIMCGEGSTDKVVAALSEVQRVLKPGGTFISVTHGSPDQRTVWSSCVSELV